MATADLAEVGIALRVTGKRDVAAAERELDKAQRTLARLALQQRQGAITEKEFNNAVTQATSKVAKKNGLLINSNKIIRAYVRNLKDATDAQLAMAAGVARSGKGLRNMELVAQQAGYQIGDFAVQVQGGTNVAVAFGQQMSQLLGFFGAGGALAGAGIAIVTGIVAPLLKARDAAEEAKKEIRKLSEVVTSLQDLKGLLEDAFEFDLKGADENLRDLIGIAAREQQFELRAKVLAGFVNVEKAVADSVAFMKERIEDAKDELSVLKSDKGTMFADENKQQILDLQKEIKTLVVEINSAQKELEAFAPLTHTNVNEPLDDTIDKLVTFGITLSKNKTLQESMGLEFEAFLEQLGLTEIVADRLKERLEEIKSVTEMMTEAAKGFADEFTGVMEHMALMDVIETAKSRTGGGRGSVVPNATDILLMRGGGVQGESYDPTSEEKAAARQAEKLAKYLRGLKDQTALQQRAVKLSDDELEIQEDLLKFKQDYGEAAFRAHGTAVEGMLREIQAAGQLREELEAQRKEQEKLAKSIEGSMEKAFMSIADGTESVKDAFRIMARDIIAELYRVFVVKQMVAGITGTIEMFSGPAAGSSESILGNGGVLSNGSLVKAYANGGVVGGPTYFPMAGGRMGLMGEAGPEAIMPLTRGPNGKLGVEASGSGSVVVNQSFNFSANGDDSVRRIIAEETPKIAELTSSAIIDQRRRGGSIRRAFK